MPRNKEKGKIGFIGAGNMGEALIKGMLLSQSFSPQQLLASDKVSGRLKYLAKTYKIKAFEKNSEIVWRSEVIILAVKPQNLEEALKEVREGLSKDKLLISILAGIPVGKVQDFLKKGSKVIRAMPNAPALVQEGATAIFRGDQATEKDEQIARRIFDSVGKTIILQDESLMDAVTGLSGSGPAYVFVILESLSDGGVKMGLSREVATNLAIQTLAGAAKLARESRKHPGELKDMITSPGGTTIVGLKKLEEGGLRASLMEAVEAATLRAKELSKGGKR